MTEKNSKQASSDEITEQEQTVATNKGVKTKKSGIDCAKAMNLESINLVYALIACMAFVSVVVIAVPLIAVLNPEVFYQSMVLVLMPLVVLSLCLSAFSVFLCASIVRNNAQAKKSQAIPVALSDEDIARNQPKVNAYIDIAAKNMLSSQSDADKLFHLEALKASQEHGLTQRETEVLELLLQGRNAERISQNLVISRHTAKTHIYNIYRKVGSSSHQELIDLFQKNVSESSEGVEHARPIASGLCAS